jgi:hypothetical protein
VRADGALQLQQPGSRIRPSSIAGRWANRPTATAPVLSRELVAKGLTNATLSLAAPNWLSARSARHSGPLSKNGRRLGRGTICNGPDRHGLIRRHADALANGGRA